MTDNFTFPFSPDSTELFHAIGRSQGEAPLQGWARPLAGTAAGRACRGKLERAASPAQLAPPITLL